MQTTKTVTIVVPFDGHGVVAAEVELGPVRGLARRRIETRLSKEQQKAAQRILVGLHRQGVELRPRDLLGYLLDKIAAANAR